MENKIYYSIGVNPSLELIKYHKENILEAIFSSKIINKPIYNEFIKLLPNNIKKCVDDKLINKISDKENSDIILKFSAYLNDIDYTKKVLIINGEDDVGAIGTIIRSSVAFNITQIIIITDSINDIYDSRLIRASMGAIFIAKVQVYGSINNLSINDNCLYIKKDKVDPLPFQIKVTQILYQESL